ncbi:MAG: lysophospholipid acyltransferase family protein [Gemmatimonadota bacterium]
MTGRIRLAELLGAPTARMLGATWRFRELDAAGEPGPAVTRLRPAIYAMWHGQLLPLAVLQRGQGAAVLVSRHRDGEILARILARLGYTAVRGSSSRGGAQGLREMIDLGRAGRPLAFTPDGPRGPARGCKAGVVHAAIATGLPIVPAAAAPSRGWRANSWDRFLLPVPGATVYVSYGEPLRLPREADPGQVGWWQAEVADRLDREVDRCERAAGRCAG